MKNTKAISIIEFIISLTILAVLLTMVFTVMAKKAKMIIPESKGVFVCWKDNKNNLLQKTFSISPNNVITETPVKKVENCEIEFAKEMYSGIKKYTVTLIGGGGGGGEPQYSNSDIYELCKYKDIKAMDFYPYEIKNNEVYQNNAFINSLKSISLFDLISLKYPDAFAFDDLKNGVKSCSISKCSELIAECKDNKCKDKISNYKILVDKNPAFAPFGTQGEDAPVNVLNNLFLTGDKVVIKNEDIASFTDKNANGGITKLLVADDSGEERVLKAMVNGGKKGKEINNYNQINLPEIKSEMSDKILWKEIKNNKIVPDLSMFFYNTYDNKYTGSRGASCDKDMICKDAENIEAISDIKDIDKYNLGEIKSMFGKGGGGASSVVKCPYILNLKYTKPQFNNGSLILNNLVEDININLKDNYFKHANASKGGGGAIIIEWE